MLNDMYEHRHAQPFISGYGYTYPQIRTEISRRLVLDPDQAAEDVLDSRRPPTPEGDPVIYRVVTFDTSEISPVLHDPAGYSPHHEGARDPLYPISSIVATGEYALNPDGLRSIRFPTQARLTTRQLVTVMPATDIPGSGIIHIPHPRGNPDS